MTETTTKNYATRKDLAVKLAEKHGLKKSEVEILLADVNPTIIELATSDEYNGYRDMGYTTVDVKDVPERTYRNPRFAEHGGEEFVTKAAHKKLHVKAGNKFKLTVA